MLRISGRAVSVAAWHFLLSESERMFLMKLASSAILLMCVCVLAGCGGRANDEWTAQRHKVAAVSGVVLLDGQPLEGATVNFFSADREVTAYGRTNAQGEFQLTTYDAGDGAVAGAHKVTVKKVETITVPNPEDPNLPPISSKETWHTPKRFGSVGTSPLSANVDPGGTSGIKLELTK